MKPKTYDKAKELTRMINHCEEAIFHTKNNIIHSAYIKKFYWKDREGEFKIDKLLSSELSKAVNKFYVDKLKELKSEFESL